MERSDLKNANDKTILDAFINNNIRNISFNNLVDIIQNLIKYTPELDALSGNLLKMDKSKLEDIVLEYGKRLS